VEDYINPAERVPGVDREQQVWSYRYADGPGQETPAAVVERKEPRLVEDVVASVVSAKEVRLAWPAAREKDLVGYVVERAPVEVLSEDEILRLKKDTPPLAESSVGAIRSVGKFVHLTKEPVKAASFTDTDLDLGKSTAIEGDPIWSRTFRDDQLDKNGKPYRFGVFAYRVRAVNARGVEGGPSPLALTIPSAPQSLFSKEEGERCHLKWAANPEKGLKGYRVYRMESPRVNGPGQPVTRLTADPVTGTRFTDEQAGKEVTRRYWVVAVDALGQEGFPSSPTWHSREFRRFYVPFVGEWHQ
jgi:hypothetical protein